jgi:hypothetical protein
MVKILIIILLFAPTLCFGAIHADTVWECQADATANSVNGGGFYNRDPGTSVDYSQQTAAQLHLTDLDMVAASTTLTSVTGGFTAAMAGNIIHITAGTNFTVGWYEITAYTDTNTVTLDRTAIPVGENNADAVGYVGGAMSLASTLDDEFFKQMVAGNIIYVEAGTYTFVEHVQANTAGTATAPISIEGYQTTRGDDPTGDNRPLFACGAYVFRTDRDYWYWKDLRMTVTHATGVTVGDRNIITNVKVHNSSATSDYEAFTSSSYVYFVNCEAISNAGNGIQTANVNYVIGSYVHDCGVTGIAGTAGYAILINNIIDTCATGVSLYLHTSMLINNTFYNCTTGVSGGTTYNSVVLSNIFDECTTPASWDTEQKSNWFDYNSWDGDKSSNVNVTAGDNSIDSDITLTDPANGDFTLGSGSACIDVGLQVGTNQGAVGDYKWNIGADQDDVTAAGAGGGAGFFFIQ